MEIPSNQQSLKTDVIEQLKKQVLSAVSHDHPLASQLREMNKGELPYTQLSKFTPALDRRIWEKIKTGITSWKEDNYDDYLDDDGSERDYVAFLVKRNFQALKDALS